MGKNTEKFRRDAAKLVELIGKDNVLSASHCQTRVRLVLKDADKVDTKTIDSLESVAGTFTAGGQFQVIIGVEVPEFFGFFMQGIDIKESSKDETKKAAVQQQTGWQKIMTAFSEIFVPLIPIIVAGGLILAFRNMLELNWAGAGNDVISAMNVPFFADLNSYLWLPANAVFWYLPVAVVWSMFNRAKQPPALGIVIGIMLVSPSILVNMYAISGAVAPSAFVAPIDSILSAGGFFSANSTIEGASGIPAFVSGGAGNYWYSLSDPTIAAAMQVTGAPGTYSIIGGTETFGDGGTAGQSIWDNAFWGPALASVGETNAASAAWDFNGDGAVNTFAESVQYTNASYFGNSYGDKVSWWPLAFSYVGQVIPALLVGAFGVWFYKFVERHTWPTVKYVWPPLATILVVQFAAVAVIGPIGGFLSFAVSYVFGLAFTNSIAKWFVGPIFGFLYPFLVITGIHHTMNAVMLQLTNTGTNYIFPILALSNMAQGTAVFAVMFLAKGDESMKEMGTSAGVTCYLGVTEPAMYGVNLKYMFPFVAAALASAVGGLLVVAFDITAIGIGMGGILGFLNINFYGTVSSTGDVNGVVGGWTQQWAGWLSWLVFWGITIITVICSYIFTLALSKVRWINTKYGGTDWLEYMQDVRANRGVNALGENSSDMDISKGKNEMLKAGTATSQVLVVTKDMTKAELLELARDFEIKGASAMNKQDLFSAVSRKNKQVEKQNLAVIETSGSNSNNGSMLGKKVANAWSNSWYKVTNVFRR